MPLLLTPGELCGITTNPASASSSAAVSAVAGLPALAAVVVAPASSATPARDGGSVAHLVDSAAPGVARQYRPPVLVQFRATRSPGGFLAKGCTVCEFSPSLSLWRGLGPLLPRQRRDFSRGVLALEREQVKRGAGLVPPAGGRPASIPGGLRVYAVGPGVREALGPAGLGPAGSGCGAAAASRLNRSPPAGLFSRDAFDALRLEVAGAGSPDLLARLRYAAGRDTLRTQSGPLLGPDCVRGVSRPASPHGLELEKLETVGARRGEILAPTVSGLLINRAEVPPGCVAVGAGDAGAGMRRRWVVVTKPPTAGPGGVVLRFCLGGLAGVPRGAVALSWDDWGPENTDRDGDRGALHDVPAIVGVLQASRAPSGTSTAAPRPRNRWDGGAFGLVVGSLSGKTLCIHSGS